MPRKAKEKPAPIVKVAPPREKSWELTQDEVTVLKNSIAKGASDTELKFCLTVARRYKLDPFKQQIWFVKRWDKSADNGKGGLGAYVFTAQVGIHGMLYAAGRDHKDFGSISLPQFGPMQAVKYVDGKSKKREFQAPEWARVKVWKKGCQVPTEAEAWWSEYAPYDLDKAPFWRKMPRRMLAKCATALAVREAYPDLGGLFIPEECERMAEDFTEGGRMILEEGSIEAAQAVGEAKKQELQAKIAAHKEAREREAQPVESIFLMWPESHNGNYAFVQGSEAIEKYVLSEWFKQFAKAKPEEFGYYVSRNNVELLRERLKKVDCPLIEKGTDPLRKTA